MVTTPFLQSKPSCFDCSNNPPNHENPALLTLRKHFFTIRCLSVYAMGLGAALGSLCGGRKIPARYLVTQMSDFAMAHRIPFERRNAVVRRHPDHISSCQITCLVTMSRAFYNPPNTALDIGGMSNRRRVSTYRSGSSASECLRNPFHFRNSQEH
jgi:hypothetical protein